MIAEKRKHVTDDQVDEAIIVIASLIASGQPIGTIKSILQCAIEDQEVAREMKVLAAFINATWE